MSPPEKETQEPARTPEKKLERLGGIEFTNMEKPLSITYPKDFDGSQTVKLENLQILVSDAEGQNFLQFIRLTQYGKDQIFVNQDVSGALIFTAHDGYIKNTNTPLELEPFRRMIEGPVTKPVSEKQIAANLEKTIGMKFVFGQDGKEAKFKIVQAKRLDAKKREEFNQKLGNLSEFLEPINHPENSVLLLTCSARQPNEPPEGQNEFFSGRLAFVLEYSP